MYVIIGKYGEDHVEQIDHADDLLTAKYLQGEYELAFGPEWKIWYREAKPGEV